MGDGQKNVVFPRGMRLCHSRVFLGQIFLREAQEMVFEAHIENMRSLPRWLLEPDVRSVQRVKS